MPEGKDQVKSSQEYPLQNRTWVIGLGSFLFILLQSICSAVIAISGLRLLIGLGSLAAASASIDLLARFHAERIRIPMEMLAIAGSLVNLYVIWRIRSLRTRPSSRWRMIPVTSTTARAETIQVALAILTLLLVLVEWALHLHLHGSI